MHTIYTVGYATWTPEQLRAEAQRLGAVVFDIRMNPTSMRPEWRKAALRQTFGSAYSHVPALGNRNYRGGPMELAAPARALPLVQAQLARTPIILLCACRDWQSCHRSLAAAHLAEYTGVPVEHLEAPVITKAGCIKALTLTQPYATLVALGVKQFETRSWATSYRGPLALHAAAGLGPVGGKRGLMALVREPPFLQALQPLVPDAACYDSDTLAEHLPLYLPLRSMVAICQLTACYPTCGNGYAIPTGQPLTPIEQRAVSLQERAFGDFSFGRFAWQLDAVQPLAWTAPVNGQLGLWDWAIPEGISI